jgi:uroporphyrinogen-III synthase
MVPVAGMLAGEYMGDTDVNGLTGKKIVITRAPHQAGALEMLLRVRGAVPLLYPCIDIAPPDDPQPLILALQEAAAGAFDWLILTSANTVAALARQLTTVALPPERFARLRVAAVGPATAEIASQALGVHIQAVPDAYRAEALLAHLPPLAGKRVLLPQSALAAPTLVEGLRAHGAQVTAVHAYQTVMGSGGVHLSAALAAREIDAITLTSASTITNLVQRLHTEGSNTAVLHSTCLACIGPSTAAAVHTHGFSAAVMPAEHTLDGLVTALEHYFAAQT